MYMILNNYTCVNNKLVGIVVFDCDTPVISLERTDHLLRHIRDFQLYVANVSYMLHDSVGDYTFIVDITLLVRSVR